MAIRAAEKDVLGVADQVNDIAQDVERARRELVA